MKSSTIVILIAVLATLGIITIGLVWASDATGERITSTGVMVLVVLLAMLKSDYDKKEVVKEVAQHVTEKAKEAAKEVKDELQVTATKREVDNAARDVKLDKIVEQTNGNLTEKLTKIENKVDNLSESKKFPTSEAAVAKIEEIAATTEKIKEDTSELLHKG